MGASAGAYILSLFAVCTLLEFEEKAGAVWPFLVAFLFKNCT